MGDFVTRIIRAPSQRVLSSVRVWVFKEIDPLGKPPGFALGGFQRTQFVGLGNDLIELAAIEVVQLLAQRFSVGHLLCQVILQMVVPAG